MPRSARPPASNSTRGSPRRSSTRSPGAPASGICRVQRRVDLTLSPQEEAFRDELREWLAENHPGQEPTGDIDAFQFRRKWQHKLHENGYAGLSWPKEYGGRGAALIEQGLFQQGMGRARAPSGGNGPGLLHGG